ATATSRPYTRALHDALPIFPRLEATRAARWIDTIGHDSTHDYDPVWAKCAELGVAPTFHAGGQGWGTRTSTTNYVYNHIGNFAADRKEHTSELQSREKHVCR